MGPTATGKTALSLALAHYLPVEIINVDATLVYRGMDILTGKPTLHEQNQVRHHLIDICVPAQPYNAGQFQRDADACIKAIQARGRIPLLVGGTMLYFKALLSGMPEIPAVDPAIKQRIQNAAATMGWPQLHHELQQCDPIAANKIQPLDKQRIERALAVFYATGQPLSSYWQQSPSPYDQPVCSIALVPKPQARAALHHRIERRFAQMLAAGGIAEVEALRAQGDCHADLPAMRSVGYRQIGQYLDGHIDKATMTQQALSATRQLAKRQLTWLRQWPALQAFDYQAPQLVHEVLQWVLTQGVPYTQRGGLWF